MEGKPPRGMKLTIISIAKIPKNDLAREYIRRFESSWAFEELFIKPSQNKVLDGQKLLKTIDKKNAFFVALDEKGNNFTSPAFADFLKAHEETPIIFGIGGADGWDEQVKARANCLLSLSQMTLPHALARLFLCEQLYRAYTLLKNLPYHRA